jgi:hypothetical protein
MGIYMKKHILNKLLFIFILILGSCREPIFYTISQEEKELEPLIKGSPTNFVEFNGNVYVGSGTTLYRYDGHYPNNSARGSWTEITPGGNIRQLAATTIMYALCGDSGNFVLKKSSNGSNWTNVLGAVPDNIKSIYAAGNTLFIGAGTTDAYSIFEFDGNNFTPLTSTGNKLLNGAASDGTNSYLITKDMNTQSGNTYIVTGTSVITTINNSSPLMGIINLNSTTIVATSRDGVLHTVTSSGVYSTGHRLNGSNSSREYFATGALAVWNNTLLLAGRQEEPKNSVNYLHGYQELDLANGTISGSGFRDPGTGVPSTVENNKAYKSNMEKNIVNFLYRAHDGILFASTQEKGVWSYRKRGDEWLWNAEQ